MALSEIKFWSPLSTLMLIQFPVPEWARSFMLHWICYSMEKWEHKHKQGLFYCLTRLFNMFLDISWIRLLMFVLSFQGAYGGFQFSLPPIFQTSHNVRLTSFLASISSPRLPLWTVNHEENAIKPELNSAECLCEKKWANSRKFSCGDTFMDASSSRIINRRNETVCKIFPIKTKETQFVWEIREGES